MASAYTAHLAHGGPPVLPMYKNMIRKRGENEVACISIMRVKKNDSIFIYNIFAIMYQDVCIRYIYKLTSVSMFKFINRFKLPLINVTYVTVCLASI
jgi:hypothetical protein